MAIKSLIIPITLITLLGTIKAQVPSSQYWGFVTSNNVNVENTLVRAWIDLNGNNRLDLTGANTSLGSEVLHTSNTFDYNGGWNYNVSVRADYASPGDSMIVRIGGDEGVVNGIDANPKLPWISGSFRQQDISVTDTTVSVNPDPFAPLEFMLAQNYPNPFNPSTNIEFVVSKNSYVNLLIRNLNGQTIENLIDREMSAGRYKATWIPKNVASGPYLYTLQVGKEIVTKKMVYTK